MAAVGSAHCALPISSAALSSCSTIARTKHSPVACSLNSLQWIIGSPARNSIIPLTHKHRPSKQYISIRAFFKPSKWEGRGRRKPVEELYGILVEKNITPERRKELRVDRWDKWETARCYYKHEWKVDELVYIVKGSVKVTPIGSITSAYFYAGDVVRFPKWLTAILAFEGLYEQKYRFIAYGDE